MAGRIPWSREELSLVLRAWADVAESRPRNLGRALFQRYEALCRAATGDSDSDSGGMPVRPEPSVLIKRQLLQNMHTVISLFLASITIPDTPTTTANASNTNGGDGKLRAWFSMPETARRRWFAAHNEKTYVYIDITEEQFDMLAEILEIKGDNTQPLAVLAAAPTAYAKPERDAKRKTPKPPTEAALSDKELAAVMGRTREQFRTVMGQLKSDNFVDTASMKEDGGGPIPAVVVEQEQEEPQEAQAVTPLPPPLPHKRANVAIESESDTESDGDWEEIVPRSPIREAVEESDAIAVSKRVSTGPLSTSNAVFSEVPSAAGNESQKRKLSPTEFVHPDKRTRSVHPEILNLLSALEKQTRALWEAFRNTKLARRRDQAERQQVLRLMRQERGERHHVLESLSRQEEEVRLQRAAWRREQEEIRREYAELDDGH